MLNEPNIAFVDLSKITAPTLVLAGERDIIPASHTQAVAAAIPSAECRILKGETHASYVLDADKLHDVLKDFLRFGLKSETESDKIFWLNEQPIHLIWDFIWGVFLDIFIAAVTTSTKISSPL